MPRGSTRLFTASALHEPFMQGSDGGEQRAHSIIFECDRLAINVSGEALYQLVESAQTFG
jgi:hypothetical protein